VGIHVMTGLGPGYLNAGLMKPRKGFTPVAGEKKLRGQELLLVDRSGAI